MGLSLRWVVHTACNVLGYQNDNDSIKCKNVVGSFHDDHDQALKRSSKVNNIKSCNGAEPYPSGFQMPLHYPRYSKADYESMEEWKTDMLLQQYGLTFHGSLEEKRAFAMGAFLWPDQY